MPGGAGEGLRIKRFVRRTGDVAPQLGKRDESCSPYSRLIWVTFSSTVVSSFISGGVSFGVLSGGGVAAAFRS